MCLGPEGECLVVEMIRRRTSDIKVGVRKAGLQALEAIVRMDTAVTRTSVSLDLGWRIWAGGHDHNQ